VSDSYKLDEFLYAIKASIYKANQKAWKQHLLNLMHYFKKNQNGVFEPKMLRMMLPTTEVDDDQVDVEENSLPVASLVEHSPLTMANLSVEFECYIEGLTPAGTKGETPSVTLVMGDGSSNLPKAKFSIEYKTNDDAPEGIARINDKLLKHF
jgi:hypothetical protein